MTENSSVTKDKQTQNDENEEGQRFKQLQVLLDGPLGLQIVESIDYV